MRRTWLDKVPAGMMVTLWLISLLWAGWWTWELWTTSDLYAGGPGIVFAVWLVPMLPLLLVTPFWLRRRARRGFWLLWTVLGVAILLFIIPFHLPRDQFDANGTHTSVPLSLYGFITVLTLVPAGSVITEVLLVIRARRSDALGERSAV